MRLDTDLGIDSIKRVEILSAVQDRLPQVGSISPEQLGTLASLRQIVETLSAGPLPASGLRRRAPEWPARRDRRTRTGPPITTGNQNGDASRQGHENGTAGARRDRSSGCCTSRRPQWSQAGDARDQVRLRAGGTVWVTSDGSPLTEAVCAALSQRDFRCPGDPARGWVRAGAGRAALRIDHPGARGTDDETFVKNAFRILRAAGPALEQSAARGGAAL